MGGSVAALENKCISAVVGWVYYRHFVDINASGILIPPHPLVLFEKAASLGFYLTCLFLIWRQGLHSDRWSRVTALAVFGLVVPLTSPISGRHAYAIAIVPLCLLWTRALRNLDSTEHVVLLSISTMSMGSLFFDVIALSPLPHFIQIISASVFVISTAALCVETLSHQMVDPGALPS